MGEKEFPNIPKFYEGKSILVTGVTGFMGKVLVEKLLRSCHGLKTIYVLVRSKRDDDPKKRLEKILESEVFSRVKKDQPHSLSKLIAIPADLSAMDLGLSTSSQSILINNVSIIFHLAATVRFDEKLKKAIEVNVIGLQKLLQLTHKMKSLEAFVHVSTAYCNCDKPVVEELVYETAIPYQKVIDAVEWMDDDMVDKLTPQLIGKYPNTYTYSKSLAESLLVNESGSLPVAIVRPSIVIATWKEPFKGWIDNYNGTTAILVGECTGIMKTMYCKRSCTLDQIPADVVINLMISVAWHTALHKPNSIPIYNCTSGSVNGITLGEMESTIIKLITKYPSNNTVLYPSGRFTESRMVFKLENFIFHWIPAYMMDSLIILTCNKPRFISMYNKAQRTIDCLEYFITHEWIFKNDNSTELLEKLSPEDKLDFNFDIKNLDWSIYLENYMLGIRKYLFKEELSNLPANRRALKRLYFYTKAAQALLLVFLWQLTIKKFYSDRQLWYSLF